MGSIIWVIKGDFIGSLDYSTSKADPFTALVSNPIGAETTTVARGSLNPTVPGPSNVVPFWDNGKENGSYYNGLYRV